MERVAEVGDRERGNVMDNLLEPMSAASPAGEDLRGTDEWQNMKRLQRRASDWKALEQACGDALRRKSKDLRIALWWTTADTHLRGFAGLAERIRLLAGLGQWYPYSTPQDENSDEDFLSQVADSLQ